MTAQQTIDTRTADVIRSAMTAAQAGRMDEARDLAERGLASGCEPTALHALIGSILCRLHDFGGAIPHLEAARAARPTDPIVTRNLATALVELERYDEALPLLTDDLVASDRTGALRRLRAYVAQMLGDYARAAADYERWIAVAPNDWETWNNLGNTRLGANDLPGGIEALRRAASLNHRSVDTRLNLARALRDAGRLADAEIELRAMAADFPSDPVPLGFLFGLLQMGGFDLEAEEALEQAIERDPTNVGMLIALGRQLLLRFAINEAEDVFRRVLTLEPSNGDAFLGLSDVLEHQRPSDLPALLADAEAAKVDAVRLNLIRALIARREKDYDGGAAALKDVPEDFDPVRRWHLQGQILDGLGDYDGAFDAFSRMNQALANEPTQPLERAAELRERLRDRLNRTTADWRECWAALPINSERQPPVFLVGFPRSGTTLLDTMLMGHPDAEVMEERPVIHQLREESGGFDAIAGMDEAAVRQLQNRYWELAAQFAPLREGALLVDKSPLHMQNLPLIYRIFPNARFILALRHPADVALSCFMAKFRMNVSMANFVDLPTIAEFYDLTFSMWERARELLPVEVHEVVYERMVEDPEAELRPLVEALGLDWNPEMLNHQRTAEARGVITTASYAQVTQPIYRGAAGRWQRYRKHLEPVLPTLKPWVEKLGYEL